MPGAALRQARGAGSIEAVDLAVSPVGTGGVDPPALVGRRAELATLGSVLAAARDGCGRVVVVEGEAGIGKSALITAALTGRDTGLRIFSTAAEEMDRHRPFGAVADAFGMHRGASGVRGEIAAALAAVELAGDAQGLSFRVAEAATTVLDEVGAPALVVAEDLHWADPASLAVLHRLARRVRQHSYTLVFSARPAPRSPELGHLLARDALPAGTAFIRLGPLDEAATSEIVRNLLGAAARPGLLASAAKAGGNPLYLREFVGALLENRLIEFSGDGSADAPRGAHPEGLTPTILGRLSFLDAQTKELLSLAAILGARFSVEDLKLLSGQAAVTLVAPLREALTAKVLSEDGQQLVFRHDLIRESLYAAIPAALRVALHREAAEALGRAGAPATKVAEHVLRSATSEDPQALSWVAAAARAAAGQDPAGAAELWRRLLALTRPSDAIRPEAEAGLALCLLASGRTAEGADLCRTLFADRRPPVAEWALRSALIQSLLVQGQLPDALSQLEQALASETLSETERGRLLAWSSQMHFFAGDLPGAQAWAERAELAAARTADAPTLARAALTHAQVASSRAQLTSALDYAARAVALSEADPSPEVYDGHAHRLTYALVLADADDMCAAAGLSAAGRVAAESAGSPTGLLFAHLAEAYIGFFAGRWDDAAAELDAAGRLAEETATGWQTAFIALDSLIALHRRGPGPAASVLAPALTLLDAGTREYRVGWVAHARAAGLAGGGDTRRAVEILKRAWDACAAAGMEIEYRMLGPNLAALAMATGDRALAERVAAAVQAVADANPGVSSLRGAAGRSRGLIDADPDQLLRAVQAYRESPRRAEQAATASDAVVALAKAGRMEEAASIAAEALEIWSELRADWSAARGRASWRRAGLRLGTRGPRRRPATGWEALSSAERNVAALMARRLSNGEIAGELFISKRTVESHVAHIFGKVGASTRAELIAGAVLRQNVDSTA